MNLHEYQAKDLFRSYGIPVPAGKVAASAEEAAAVAGALGGAVWVVKAQVHAGGRGKAGGVKLARDLDAVRAAAAGMLGKRLVTAQTGAEGLPVERVYVEAGSDIAGELTALRDASQEDPMERRASEHDLNYVSLDGDIACMVNGAGLAMATMDLIKLHHGRPANFLDVGGGATSERVTAAFELILSNSRVRAVLVNIFGGIVRCDLIADGVIKAVKKVGVEVPVVVRLEGTNAEAARAMLASSGLTITAAKDLTDAARKVVALAAKGKA